MCGPRSHFHFTDELLEQRPLPICLDFNFSIVQVSDKPSQTERFCAARHKPPKPHPLNQSFNKNMYAGHRHNDFPNEPHPDDECKKFIARGFQRSAYSVTFISSMVRSSTCFTLSENRFTSSQMSTVMSLT